MEFPRLDGHAIALDYESNGLKYWRDDFQVIGVSIATADSEWYWDIRTTPNVGAWLRDVLPRRQIYSHFAQYEYQCTRLFGIDPRSINWFCTMTGDCLLFEKHLTYDLHSVAVRHGIPSRKAQLQEEIRLAIGCRTVEEAMRRLEEAPPELVAMYGASDTRICYDVATKLLPRMQEEDLMQVMELEMQLMPVLADMSWGGVRVNLEACEPAIKKLDEKELILQREVGEITGNVKFNVNSTPQIREFFKPESINKYQWRLIDGTLVLPTKTGKGPSIDQTALRNCKHPLATKILDLRKTIKLRDTFIRGHIIGNADDRGYVHTTFNQTRNDADAGVVTGRLSSTDPALQQITKRDKENAAILRSMFIPDDRCDWGCFDYNQVDFRCAAHLINDPEIIAAYAANPKLDYHQVVSEMTGIPRNAPYAGAPNTKQINLGLAFGAGAGKLSFMMGMEYTMTEWKGKMTYQPGPKAREIFDLYHAKLPGVKNFMRRAEDVAKATGYVRTAIGRRLRLGRGEAHKAAGLLFQAYAADLHKTGLVRSDRLIREEKIPMRMMLSVHDEMDTSIEKGLDQQTIEHVRHIYSDFNSENSPIRMRVPILSSASIADNWYLASKD